MTLRRMAWFRPRGQCRLGARGFGETEREIVEHLPITQRVEGHLPGDRRSVVITTHRGDSERERCRYGWNIGTPHPSHLCILHTADLARVLGEAPSDGYEREARGQHDEGSLEQM